MLRDGILSFDADGTLTGITTSDAVDSQQQVEFFSGMLVPGFVNAHCHLELSYLHGRIGRGCGFAGFADAIARVRHEATPEQRADAAAYRDARMTHDGVIAAGDICNGPSTFALKQHSRIHYHNFIEGFGLRTTDFSGLYRIAGEARTAGLAASVTPHATYSLQDAPFRQIAANGNPLSIHFMESRGEQELFEGRGLLHERNRRDGVTIDFAGYGSPAGRILSSVPQDKNILLVHNTFATPEIIERLHDRFGKRITWVLCPRSNDFIEGAKPPVESLRQSAGRIAIGTDSLASNDSLSIVDELKMFPEVPLAERLGWATLGGAEALGIDAWAGSFVPGKRPGAVLITGVDWNTMTLLPHAASRRIL